MRHHLMIALCVFLALIVLWVCVHPNVDLAPTAFRFTAFAAAVMILLRMCFRFTPPTLVLPFASRLMGDEPLAASGLECFAFAQTPLRC